ncbi:MAG: hypothetical protein JF616_04225 [Fibrobacteres bacterium]|nr:hypothetical protein [Fibrobacterota bacterium]
MRRKPNIGSPKIEAALALGLLLSFFLPWLRSMGKPVSAPEIRGLLEGPHRFFSSFHAGSRVSIDYRLSLLLWTVPIAAGCILMAIALRRYRGWMAVVAGSLAAAAFFFLQHEVEGFPFHRLAWGAYLALGLGAALLFSALWRILIIPP